MAAPRAKVRVEVDLNLGGRVSQRALERGLRGAMLEGVRLTKEELSQPGSGRIYKRGSTTHQASAPGESPAPDSGTLRESTDGDVLVRNGVVTAEISVRGEQAEHLELGTENIEPRPILAPLLGRNASRLYGAFVKFARGL